MERADHKPPFIHPHRIPLTLPAARDPRAPERRDPAPPSALRARYGGGAAGAGPGPAAAERLRPPAGAAARERLRGAVGGETLQPWLVGSAVGFVCCEVVLTWRRKARSREGLLSTYASSKVLMRILSQKLLIRC
ncbi:D-aminoacyl-tRNA deacylase 2 isoform X3 [Onychostruthus taczanowskii]|uniref:D-aminoacyl-tRNA deacylase 2 isoform X3 n=1 Tax=Onychostruthus taczanowskii TaxID=356909 RepID=UPI001B8023F1|nr:D-aminoacyl-tRNA deacylase 2 isoform X3 [Onychostruthus taczanowskii]